MISSRDQGEKAYWRRFVPFCFLFIWTGCFSSTSDESTASLIRKSGESPSASAADAMSAFTNTDADELDVFEEVPVPPPPFSPGVFPCSTCHSMLKDNFVKRKLTKAHTYIKLNHGPREKWCFECHNQYNRDKLKLSNGSTIPFTESYKLCGQCHGPIYRDWRAGAHGKRTGYWNGTKEYLLCAHCHDPHSPRFKPIKPKPPPVRHSIN